MPTGGPISTPPRPSLASLIATVGLVSAGVLAFEIALMRVLLIASWHHFAFLVISIALLGFGMSGTVLALLRHRLARATESAMALLAAMTAISMPLCAGIAQLVPLEARLAPVLFWRQAGFWLLYWCLLTVPFLLGATTIGLGLIAAGQRVATVYAANLVGSGIGAALATAAMTVVSPQWLPSLAAAVAGIGAIGAVVHHPSRRLRAAMTLLVAGAAVWVWLVPPNIRVDPFKYASHLARLRQQSDAQRISTSSGPRGVIEIYRSPSFHELPFLELGASPPPILALTIDGHRAGNILDIGSPEDAIALRQTLTAVPYALLESDRPAVLLLGERGSANIWLAALQEAVAIDAVQPDAALPRLLRDASPALRRIPGLRLIVADPRHFAERPGGSYDLIQLASLEGSAAGSGGVMGLGQDFLLTLEGLDAVLLRLNPEGILTVCRGIQTPPRDNLKLLASLAEALRRQGIEDPSGHIVIVRDYLAVCTMARRQPWTASQIERARLLIRDRQLTPVWFDGIRDDELNHPDALPGPGGGAGDWYHYAASQLLGPEPGRFTDDWLFDIRPPTDDRPFFFDFCRLRAIGAMRQAFGDLWLTRAELAYLFVLTAIGIIAVVATATLILPLLLSGDVRRAWGKWTTAGYFASIGLGYMLLEMVMLSRLAQLCGDAVLGATVTITTFLLGSGAGSLMAQRVLTRGERVVSALIGGVVLLGALLVAVLPPLTAATAALPAVARVVAGIVLVLPLALLMGLPMPVALARLDRFEVGLVPWAWGVNGFASVLAGSLGTAIGMTWGFRAAALLAIACYGVAAVLLWRLPRSHPNDATAGVC